MDDSSNDTLTGRELKPEPLKKTLVTMMNQHNNTSLFTYEAKLPHGNRTRRIMSESTCAFHNTGIVSRLTRSESERPRRRPSRNGLVRHGAPQGT